MERVTPELEALAARLAARHATPEELRVLQSMIDDDRKVLGDAIQLRMHFVDEIPTGANGKFRVTLCELPDARA